MSKTPLKLTVSPVASYWIPTRFYFPSVSLSPQMAIRLFQLLRTEKWWYCLFFPSSHNPEPNVSDVLLAPATALIQHQSPFYHLCHCHPWASQAHLSARLLEQPKGFPCFPASMLAHLQSVLNTIGRVSLLKQKSERVTPLFKILHWLPVFIREEDQIFPHQIWKWYCRMSASI